MNRTCTCTCKLLIAVMGGVEVVGDSPEPCSEASPHVHCPVCNEVVERPLRHFQRRHPEEWAQWQVNAASLFGWS